MKNIIKRFLPVAALSLALASCSDFDEVNNNPLAASMDQVEVEYALSNSIIMAQMDPDISERAFVLYWKGAGRQTFGAWESGLVDGTYNDGWSSNYYYGIAKWIATVNLAIEKAEINVAAEGAFDYQKNQLQMARIWRAYLMSEFADSFGPMPIPGEQTTMPEYASVKDVYYYVLAELKDASEKMVVSITDEGEAAKVAELAKFDPAYGYDFAKWQKYANSMRLRLAMRLSEVDATKAQAEFEDAATKPLLLEADEMFAVKEKDGWDPLTGVMTRSWSYLMLSQTRNNIMTGLGGIQTSAIKPAYTNIKDADWMGVKYDKHFAMNTNDPQKGFWLDGMPNTIDPRAYSIYTPQGDAAHKYASHKTDAVNMYVLNSEPDEDEELPIEAQLLNCEYMWNGGLSGAFATLNQYNGVYALAPYFLPALSNRFRTSTDSRVFFAAWETNFLLAEGAVRGWATPKAAQAAYEDGIAASFDYWGLGAHTAAYIASEDYNRVGTSVSFTHTAEMGAVTMRYKDGYTDAESTTTLSAPVNTIYKGGVNNDALNKIITQKFIANDPWLPLECWSDHRRLGLPFFENPAVEETILSMPALNSGNSTSGNQIAFFPQRIPYPSGLQYSNPAGYEQAIGHLGTGGDAVLTPLWWAQK